LIYGGNISHIGVGLTEKARKKINFKIATTRQPCSPADES